VAGGAIFIGSTGRVAISRILIEHNLATQNGEVSQSKGAVFNKNNSMVRNNIPNDEFQ
jgi:hypothetical protein